MFKSLFCFIFFWIFSLYGILGDDDELILKIENGKIRGRSFQSTYNQTIYAFQDIPYATPPIGELRFKEAIPPKNWNGVLNTTENKKICWETRKRKMVDDPRENEDCLYINVYIQQLPKIDMELLPVMVYIYGGFFHFGDATSKTFNPQLFVAEGIVSVFFNFRSGPLGFLTTEDGVIPGNLGLKDQNLALKWVQRNIRFFGGDPLKVSIMGHSSGGAFVAYHLVSKKSAETFKLYEGYSPGSKWNVELTKVKHKVVSTNLFKNQNKNELAVKNFDKMRLWYTCFERKDVDPQYNTKRIIRSAMPLSTTALTNIATIKYAKYTAYEMGKALSPSFTSANSSEDLLQILMNTPASIISNISISLPPHMYNVVQKKKAPIWAPVIEDSNCENAFIDGPMHDNLRDGNFNKVPLLIGVSSEEILMMASDIEIKEYAARHDKNISSLLNNNINIKSGNIIKFATELKQIYTNSSFQEDLAAEYRYDGDMMFSIPMIRHAHLQSQYTDVYFYQFSYFGEISKVRNNTLPNVKGLGKSGHRDIIVYLLYADTHAYVSDEIHFPPLDIMIRKRLIKLFTNFIKYSNPTPVSDPFLQNVIWPKFTPENFSYLDIDENLSIGVDPRHYSKWVPLIDKYYEHPLASI